MPRDGNYNKTRILRKSFGLGPKIIVKQGHFAIIGSLRLPLVTSEKIRLETYREYRPIGESRSITNSRNNPIIGDAEISVRMSILDVF